MTLSIPLQPETEAALRSRATMLGKDPAEVASELLTAALHFQELTRQRLRQISGDSYEAFRSSGVTDEQLGAELEDYKHAQRKNGTGPIINVS